MQSFLKLAALNLPFVTVPSVHAVLTGYSFGSAFQIGVAYHSPIDIISLSTTFVPGPAPSGPSGELYVWPGLESKCLRLLRRSSAPGI